MVPSRRSRNESTTFYRVALWTAVAIVGLLAWLDNSPLHLDTDAKQADIAPSVNKKSADVLVVIDWRAVHDSGSTFRTQDWSAAWVGMLQQEIGPVQVLTPGSLNLDRLDEARVVVLTASVSDSVPASLRKKLRRQALDGKLIVVERPDGELREAFSANGRAGPQRGRSLTFARGLEEPYATQLTEMPVDTEYIGSTSPREGATTLLSMDGAPVVYAAPIGDGTVVTVEFDLGEQLVSLQQGRPTDDFRVEGESPAAGDTAPPTVDALPMAPDKTAGAEVPWADLLERFMVHGVIGRYAPLPGLWAFPGGALGAVVPIHCDRRLGDGGGWMLEYEAEQNAASTVLSSVDSGLTAAGAAVMNRRGGEIGLFWRRAGTPEEIEERIGVLGLEPLARPLTLETQIDRLADTIPGRPRTTKIMGRWWDRDWTAPFLQMAANGIRVDTSYEPSTAGFSFGTGLPFEVLGPNGLPLGVWEQPVVLPAGDTGGPTLDTLLNASRRGHHQVLTWSLPSSAFADYPDMSRFDDWIGSFETIRRADHLITSVSRLNDYRRKRRASRLNSRLIRDASPPKGKGPQKEGAEAGSGKGLLLRVSVETADGRSSLMVPARIDGHRFDQARRRASRVGGKLVARKLTTEKESIVGYPVRRIPLESGSSRIDVYYQKP